MCCILYFSSFCHIVLPVKHECVSIYLWFILSSVSLHNEQPVVVESNKYIYPNTVHCKISYRNPVETTNIWH